MTEKLNIKKSNWGVIIVLVIFSIPNILAIQKNFTAWANYTRKAENNDFENTTLKEVELMADFIIKNSHGKKEVFLDGNNLYLFKFEKSIEYFTLQSGIILSPKSKAQSGDLIFQLNNAEKKVNPASDKNSSLTFISSLSIGRFEMIEWQKK